MQCWHQRAVAPEGTLNQFLVCRLFRYCCYRSTACARASCTPMSGCAEPEVFLLFAVNRAWHKTTRTCCRTRSRPASSPCLRYACRSKSAPSLWPAHPAAALPLQVALGIYAAGLVLVIPVTVTAWLIHLLSLVRTAAPAKETHAACRMGLTSRCRATWRQELSPGLRGSGCTRPQRSCLCCRWHCCDNVRSCLDRHLLGLPRAAGNPVRPGTAASHLCDGLQPFLATLHGPQLWCTAPHLPPEAAVCCSHTQAAGQVLHPHATRGTQSRGLAAQPQLSGIPMLRPGSS